MNSNLATGSSGTANWFVAKAATEGNFEIELTWNREREQLDETR